MFIKQQTQLAFAFAGVFLAAAAFAQASPTGSSRRPPILSHPAYSQPNPANLEEYQNTLHSAVKAGQREMFTLAASTSIFGFLTLAMLGWVAHKARHHEPKLSIKAQPAASPNSPPEKGPKVATPPIYTSDLYDVGSRGRGGQPITLHRSRDWHYQAEASSFPTRPAPRRTSPTGPVKSDTTPPRNPLTRELDPQGSHKAPSSINV